MSLHDSHLNGLIDRFLEDHRESLGGGWAEITPEDINDLYEIIRELIDLKCDKDADGDFPIQVKIVNRRTHEHLHYDAVPYREQRTEDNEVEREVPFMDMLRVLMMNLNMASNRLDTEVRVQQHREIERKLDKGEEV